jgi:hypothetical protein
MGNDLPRQSTARDPNALEIYDKDDEVLGIRKTILGMVDEVYNKRT